MFSLHCYEILFSILFAMSTYICINAFLIQDIVHFNQQVKDEEEEAAQV